MEKQDQQKDDLSDNAKADKCLNPVQLHMLEKSFRDWAGEAPRPDIRLARHRILVIFLLIRYTGAKLSEVLHLDPFRDIDFETNSVSLGQADTDLGRPFRKIPLPEIICREIYGLIAEPEFKKLSPGNLKTDPGFVRRKFYERAEACGFSKAFGAPELLRRSRAVELIANNMPLPAVQRVLGHMTSNSVSSYVSLSEDEFMGVTRFFTEKESGRKTSARNSFFGRIETIQTGDIQSRIEILTLGGHSIAAIITNDSCQRLGLKKGKWVGAEIKAPWIMVLKSRIRPLCSADNIIEGIVEKIISGEINTEYQVKISDGTKICSLVTRASSIGLSLSENDPVWVMFSSLSVVLRIE